MNNVFKYSKGCLYWAERPESDFSSKRGHSLHLSRYAGKKAGNLGVCGYVQVRYKGELLYAHRVVWTMHHGDIPDGYEIDHINNKRDDNRIENLRLVTSQQNKFNMSKPRNNTSGYKGVSLYKGTGRYAAHIKVNGKKVHLGYFSTAEIAHEAYKEASLKYHGDHGKA